MRLSRPEKARLRFIFERLLLRRRGIKMHLVRADESAKETSMDVRALVHSAMPKSASQYLSALIENSFPELGHPIQLKIAPGFGHNFIDPSIVSSLPRISQRFHFYGHIPLTNYNRALLEGIDPQFSAIVSIRSLPDIVVSYIDHALSHGFGPLDMRVGDLTEVKRRFEELAREAQHQLIIDHVMPWVSRYVASWLSASEDNDILFLRFEDVVSKPSETLALIETYLRQTKLITSPRQIIDTQLAVNFNEGEVGRGRCLTSKQIDQLARQAEIVRDYPQGTELFKYMTESF
jgi:hypothetical protein